MAPDLFPRGPRQRGGECQTAPNRHLTWVDDPGRQPGLAGFRRTGDSPNDRYRERERGSRMLVRLISAGIALAAMALGPAICADELPAPRIRKTTSPAGTQAAVTQALRPAPRRTPAATSDLQAIDLGTPKHVAPVAMEGPSAAYRALERRIYGRSRSGGTQPTSRQPTSRQPTSTATRTRLRNPAVRPLDLRKTYAPERAPARGRVTADQQRSEGSRTERSRIVTRSRRESAQAVRPTRARPSARAPRAPVSAPTPTQIIEPVFVLPQSGLPQSSPRSSITTGAGVIPPDPAVPAIPRGPAAIRRLDVPGCLDGT